MKPKNVAMLKFLILCILVCAIPCKAVEKEDNVIILSGRDEYTVNDNKNTLTVKNIVTREYEATRKSENIQPHIYYNSVISLDKASGGKALYRNVNNPMVFHDDSKVCYFDIWLSEKGKKAKTEFRRTFNDPAYFTKVFIQEEYPIKSKSVVFNIPSSMNRLKLIERNFGSFNITRDDKQHSDGSRTVTYTMTDLPGLKEETGSPKPMSAEPYILISGYFNDVAELYKWHHERSVVDETIPDIDALMDEIMAEECEECDTIGTIYRWVQRNIRYVAYEEGDAGYRPDTPAEVVRKRYGDCKGMSTLLATLLRHKGYDAHVASTGTDAIPFLIGEVPSLASTDHMICVTYNDGDTLYLDATNEYIHPGYIPSSIQGKDVLVDRGEDYELYQVPRLPVNAAADTLAYEYNIVDGALVGAAGRTFTGDMKEYFMTALNAMKKDRQSDAIAKSLIPGAQADVDREHTYFYPDIDGGRLAVIAGVIINRDAITAADDKLYIDLNTTADPFTARIDTKDRKNDYELPFRASVFREISLIVPDSYDITEVPDDFSAEIPQGRFSCSYKRNGQKVTLYKRMELENTRIPLADINRWNKTVSDWNNACNRQIELTLKK